MKPLMAIDIDARMVSMMVMVRFFISLSLCCLAGQLTFDKGACGLDWWPVGIIILEKGE